MKRDLPYGAVLACAIAVVFAAGATARVAGTSVSGGRGGAPPGLPPTRSQDENDLAAAIRDNAPLPVLLTSAPPPEPRVVADARVIEGPVEEVLYGRPNADPVERAAVALALKLFAHRLDLTRDVALGDRVRLVVGPSLATAPVLDYAELDGRSAAVRLYRADSGTSAAPRYVSETGVDLERFLLRTPLSVTRITSGFGPRLHPLLGYTRMHRGVDLAAPKGTPVLAAGDGVVEAAGWDGGYGRRILLRHADGFETLYGHLSAMDPTTVAGGWVRQGQVIGWTGDSGQATGPHLHFEVRRRGTAIDPSTARPVASVLEPDKVQAFEARKRAVAALLAARGRGQAGSSS